MSFFNKFFNKTNRINLKCLQTAIMASTFIINNSNNSYCPNEFPNYCDKYTNSYGLCKKNICDCNNINIDGVIPIIKTINKEGEKFGYFTENLHKRCNKIFLDYELKEDYNINVPNEFKILTYNIWGLFNETDNEQKNKFIKKTIEMRMVEVSKEILKNDPDIICFQEMTDITYKILDKEIGHIYQYKYEKNFSHQKLKINRNRDVEVCIFSKYPVKNIKLYGLMGNQKYNDSLIIAEFPNLIIFNCYLQSGSKYSPGQEDYYQHYSRCRVDQLKEIKKIINSYLEIDKNKPIILMGDFNFHLDGNKDEWIEINEINNFMEDSWKKNNHSNNGFTENTDINRMRWNLKFHEKKVRYDGILFKNLKSQESKIIGNNPIKLNIEDTSNFIKYVLKNNVNLKYSPEDNNCLELFPSDHFGVITKFIII
jgi:exonuclease III